MSADAERPGLVLMTKPAIPGRVKTRLIGRLGADGSARLHEAFLADVLEVLADGRFSLRVGWALEPEEPVPPPGDGVDDAFRQVGDDLGARLFHALRRAGRDHTRIAAIGSDHPEIDAATVEEAFGRLAEADVVLGPAADGGYFLIALRREALRRGLFEGIAWSTSAVCAQTIERARQLGLTVDLLSVGHDIDDGPALDALASRLRAAPQVACPRTRALLTEWQVMTS